MTDSRSMFDTVVVGNGVIGLTCAIVLAERLAGTIRLAVVGPRQRRGGASVAAGAMLGCHGEITAEGLSTTYGRQKFAMARKAKAMWPDWYARLSERAVFPPLVKGTTIFVNARSGDIEDDNFTAMLRQLRTDNVAHSEPDVRDISGFRPTMDARAFRLVHIADENALDAVAYIEALENLLLSSMPGVTLIDDEVEVLRLARDTRILGVQTISGRRLDCGQVVLAAGVGCQLLLDRCEPLRYRIPKIYSGVGSSILAKQPTESVRHVLRTPNRSFACGLHVVPRGEQIYVGATNTVREHQEYAPRAADIHFLLDCAIPQINEMLHSSSIDSLRTGCRPLTSDGLVVIGKTSIDGLIVASGTYREGILLSPLLAEHIANLIDSGPDLVEPMFLPERAPLWQLSLEDAVEFCVRHFISVLYENTCHLPKVGWEEFLFSVLRREVRSIYEMLNLQRLPPIDLVFLLRDRCADFGYSNKNEQTGISLL